MTARDELLGRRILSACAPDWTVLHAETSSDPRTGDVQLVATLERTLTRSTLNASHPAELVERIAIGAPKLPTPRKRNVPFRPGRNKVRLMWGAYP